MGSTRFQATKALAYQLWLEAGCPEGCSQEHWLEAERRIKQREAMAGTRLTLHTNPSLPDPWLRGRGATACAIGTPVATTGPRPMTTPTTQAVA